MFLSHGHAVDHCTSAASDIRRHTKVMGYGISRGRMRGQNKKEHMSRELAIEPQKRIVNSPSQLKVSNGLFWLLRDDLLAFCHALQELPDLDPSRKTRADPRWNHGGTTHGEYSIGYDSTL